MHKKQKPLSPFLKAVAVDKTLPIDDDAVKLWLQDLQNPMRWVLRPLLQFIFAIILHITWLIKRLLPNFSAHQLLQKLICWFCKHFVSVEANQLILRHYAVESNIINFLLDNSQSPTTIEPITLYPKHTDDMLQASFVDHDQELFRVMAALGEQDPTGIRTSPPKTLCWKNWKPIQIESQIEKPGRFQVLDFETSHALFMCLFCLLLTAEEYRDAINGFNLDQSIAIRIGHIISDQSLTEMAYNKYPLYLVGPWNLTQRFLMHGFFTEYVYAKLEHCRTHNTGLKSA